MSTPHSSSVIRMMIERVDTQLDEGKTNEAARTAETAVEASRRAVEANGEDTPILISALEKLGDLRREAGDYPSTETLYLEALEWAKTVEIDSSQLARLKSSLAAVYDFSQLPDCAIPLYEEAIALFESLSPPAELDVANLRNNLGMLYKEAGNFDRAEENYIKSLEVFERVLGRDDPDVAAVYNNLGTLYYSSGYSAQAREMHNYALEIRSKISEPNHPDLGQSYSNLATVLHELGEDDEALKNYETALRILEDNIDSDGETFYIVSSNFAALMRDLGKVRKAQAIEKRTQKLLKRQTA